MSLFDPSDFVFDNDAKPIDNRGSVENNRKRDAPYSPTRAISDDEDELERAPVYTHNSVENGDQDIVSNSDDEVVPRPMDTTSDNIMFDMLQVSRTSDGDDEDSLKVPNLNRIARRVMTRFERCNIIGTRAQQIALGAEPLIDPEGELDPLIIAEKELAQYKIPMVIRRYLPDGTFEDWAVQDFNPNNFNTRESD